MDLDFLVRRPIAHRGLHDTAAGVVENCQKAFSAAISDNYAIECDVQLSADGEAMVFHDFTLERLTEATGEVAHKLSKELKSMTFKNTSDSMLTLPELFSLVAGRVPLVVEIKSRFNGDMALTMRAASLARTYKGPLALMSFDPMPIAWLAREAPDIVRGIVAQTRYSDNYWDHLSAATRAGLEAFDHEMETRPHFLSWRVADLPSATTARYRGAGRPVICWTVRTEGDRAQAKAYADQVTFEGYRA